MKRNKINLHTKFVIYTFDHTINYSIVIDTNLIYHILYIYSILNIVDDYKSPTFTAGRIGEPCISNKHCSVAILHAICQANVCQCTAEYNNWYHTQSGRHECVHSQYNIAVMCV